MEGIAFGPLVERLEQRIFSLIIKCIHNNNNNEVQLSSLSGNMIYEVLDGWRLDPQISADFIIDIVRYKFNCVLRFRINSLERSKTFFRCKRDGESSPRLVYVSNRRVSQQYVDGSNGLNWHTSNSPDGLQTQ